MSDKKQYSSFREFNGKTYVSLGSMNENKAPDNEGRPTYSVKLSNDVQIEINGKKNKSGYLNIERPVAKFERMLAAGKMSPEDYSREIARYAEGGDLAFVKFNFEIVLED